MLEADTLHLEQKALGSAQLTNSILACCSEAVTRKHRGTQRQSSENNCSEDDLRSRIFGTFIAKFLACLPLLGFSNI